MSAAIETFTRRESAIRSYCRSFPIVFARAQGAELIAEDGRRYIDFLAGCSTLNYGHNDADMKLALVDYILRDGIAHGLDMYTEAKAQFIAAFEELILEPRGMDYRLQFTGPTGANAVEAALKLARKVTGRHQVVAFTNGFHGVTLGALACTGNGYHRSGAGVPLEGVTRMPYDGYLADGATGLEMLAQMLDDPSSGLEAPAAFIVETVQGEGGLNVASAEWLRGLEQLARKHGSLLIVDDIQAGCGRTGTFFSFEDMGISPDIVTLAKSLSGMGLPFAMVMMKPEHDIWKPAEHNGTFRGNNHAFVTARVALEKFWKDGAFAEQIAAKGEHLGNRLAAIARKHGYATKGRGMFRGIDLAGGETASAICAACFERGLVIETSGARDEVVKVLAPLTIKMEQLDAGLDKLAEAFAETHRSAAAA
ncbi:MAG: diaminobutyrate--2-oxoglutarate transaminase [Kiloniellaceae bacterium]